MPLSSDQPVTTFHPYAKRLAAALKRLGIATVRDLLLHTPVRHEDLRAVVSIRDIGAGQHVVVRGRIVTIANRRSPRRHVLITEALVSDSSGTIRCTWFQQPYLAHAFAAGTSVIIAGSVVADAYGLHIANPMMERDRGDTLHAGRLVPMYALTSGITQKQLRFLVHAALPHIHQLSETLPEHVRQAEGLVDIHTAIRDIHFPTSLEEIARARERLAFEEVYAYFLQVRASREDLDQAIAPVIPTDDAVMRDFMRQLPFSLTAGQERAVKEVLLDMAGSSNFLSPFRTKRRKEEGEKKEGFPTPMAIGGGRWGVGTVRPMQRLLNGDVGSGKTVVSAIAAANVARAGFQAAYLAPTEILAAQQERVFVRLLQPLGIRVALWTRTLQMLDGVPSTARLVAAAARAGEVSVVIGTHALLAERVRFHRLALVIVDEQHRFGVEQRAALRSKARSRKPEAGSKAQEAGSQWLPHLLSMTATPIPRTLALTLLGDLDQSVLDERPPGRTPVRTSVVTTPDRLAMTRAIREELDGGHQVFVVCPKIDVEDSGATGQGEFAAVEEAFERAQRAFPGVAIGMLHGRLRKDTQRAVMAEFLDRRITVLVATTIIEVGVDCPNVTVMVIEDAERFGLAQLHQLRGRVGRGDAPGACYLTTRSEDAAVHTRLRRVAECTDGFRLAELDLQERGPGVVVGQQQSGWPEFRYATMDSSIFRRARDAAVVGKLERNNDVHIPAIHLE
ncbi:MAG: ATP-dependent DNA helicase RecG [bacterium]|nr:ATP-dependent DNA helicase RecG [bacterium]